jgi:hypothetical protein
VNLLLWHPRDVIHAKRLGKTIWMSVETGPLWGKYNRKLVEMSGAYLVVVFKKFSEKH